MTSPHGLGQHIDDVVCDFLWRLAQGVVAAFSVGAAVASVY